MAYDSNTPQVLDTVLKRSVDDAMRVVAVASNPFVSMLPIVKTSGHYEHEWLSNGVRRYTTLLDGALTGGSATESADVDSTAGWAVGDTGILHNASGIASQMFKVTVVTDTDTMTLSSIDGSTALLVHADNTRLTRIAAADAYGTDSISKVEADVLYDNTVQQFDIAKTIAELTQNSELISGQSWKEAFGAKVIADLKKKVERQFLVGEELVPSVAGSTAQAQGLIPQLVANCPSLYQGDISSTADALISFINKVMEYDDALKGKSNVLMVDTNANAAIYKLQADAGGVVNFFNDSQSTLQKINIAGVVFTYVVTNDLNPISDDGIVVALSFRDPAGQSNLKRAIVKETNLVEKSGSNITSSIIGAASYCTLQVSNYHTHGVFMNKFGSPADASYTTVT